MAPWVLIERVRYEQKWHALGSESSLRLPDGVRDLTVKFTALSFQDPRSVRFEYMLQGFDPGWLPLEDATHHSATYTNLPPDRHQFRVRAANNVGVWNDQEASLEILVPPHFYETWWFYLLLALAFILLALAWHKRRVLVLQKQRHSLEEVVRLRTEELRVATITFCRPTRSCRMPARPMLSPA